MSWKNSLGVAFFLGSFILGNSLMASDSIKSVDQFQITLDVDVLSTENCSLRKPQAVILHYTAGDDKSAQECLTTGEVSAHYLVKSDTTIAQIVPEGKRAWHSGNAFWRSFPDLNSLSLGVEITGYGFEGGHVPEKVDRRQCVVIPGSPHRWFPFPDDQFQSLAALLVDFRDRWHIKPQFFIGHSDVALGRKVDPGPLFPWERLHKEFGLGAWPDLEKELQHIEMPTVGAALKWTQLRLRDYGYHCPLTGDLDEGTVQALQAFQMHFRPQLIDGQADGETRLILAHLVDQYHYGDS